MRFLKLLGRFLSPAFEVFKTVNNTLILGVLFYLVISPFALIRRFFGGTRLHRRIDKSAHSYFEDPQKMSERFENPF